MPWKRVILICLATVVASVSGFLVFADSAGTEWTEDRMLRSELETLLQVNLGLVSQNRRLSRDLRALKNNPVVIEKAAREDFGYIKEGEIVVILDE